MDNYNDQELNQNYNIVNDRNTNAWMQLNTCNTLKIFCFNGLPAVNWNILFRYQ